LHADAQFFGFSKPDSASFMQLYEESAFLENPKAMLALGTIFEKGLADD
jgi:hypothetical protein